jgi:phosphoribosylanthranilate isomerase
MLGFVFAPSPRRISQERAGEIVAALPESIVKVGVFVDENRRRVEELARMCHLNFVQLHGSETPEYARELGLPFIKAFRVRDETVVNQITEFGAEMFLLDSYNPQKTGGTGRKFDWSIAATAARLGRMILAGGLTPENVAEAVRIVRPYAVDVSSGVEVSPGKKDHAKIRKFIAEARG